MRAQHPQSQAAEGDRLGQPDLAAGEIVARHHRQNFAGVVLQLEIAHREGNGAFRVKGSLYSRIDDPITFWMTVGSYVACIAVPLGFMIYSAWDIMKPVR